MDNDTWDVIIIGGGSAGLSAALMLGRSRRRVLVLDDGKPRNRFVAHMHGVLGRDHTSPLALLADGRAELARYDSVEVRDASVSTARAHASGFSVELDPGATHRSRRLLVASGLRDQLPDIPGLADQWGRGVVICPYCDGWEVRDRRIVVIAGGPASTHQAQLMRQLSNSVSYLVNGSELPDEAAAGLRARGITIDDRPIAAIVTDAGDVLTGIRFADGSVLDADAVFAGPLPMPNDALLRALGANVVERQGTEWVEVDGFGRTSVPGLWATGNITDGRSSVPYAMSAGNMAGAGLNADLVEEDVRISLDAA
ncbi:NAD(P)/FAD-dependent oxidoreductase [Glaciibacter flavus]|uniref:NAD(P)/FAD-dependent oxidoreductase n=1 Tax=Orlajensenia flava TaxID=2565934 RepID=A0A4S4FRP4_9MICO|nr:NAD(P)/FAD-dependent oxidoreductase [Glaciibacter flavus]THG32116.1 NAD(P)/FAD-dependent oxidoreductase [Glaciibacter flavus]